MRFSLSDQAKKEGEGTMDNNQQVPTQVAPTQPQVQAPWPGESASQNAGQPEKHSNKLIFFLLLGIVLIAVVVGGGYFYMSNKQAADLKKEESAIQTLPVTTPKPTEASLDSQLNDINVATDESDFIPIDQDLQSL